MQGTPSTRFHHLSKITFPFSSDSFAAESRVGLSFIFLGSSLSSFELSFQRRTSWVETGSCVSSENFVLPQLPGIRNTRMSDLKGWRLWLCEALLLLPSLPDSFPSHWLSTSRIERGPKFLSMSDDRRRMLLSWPSSFCLVLPIQTSFTISVLGAKHETLIPAG